jgi:hypothetical protein
VRIVDNGMPAVGDTRFERRWKDGVLRGLSENNITGSTGKGTENREQKV